MRIGTASRVPVYPTMPHMLHVREARGGRRPEHELGEWGAESQPTDNVGAPTAEHARIPFKFEAGTNRAGGRAASTCATMGYRDVGRPLATRTLGRPPGERGRIGTACV